MWGWLWPRLVKTHCLLFWVGGDRDAAADSEGHFVGRGIYSVTWWDLEEGVRRFFSFDIG